MRANPDQGLRDGEAGRLVLAVEDGHEAHHAVVRHASATTADRDGSRELPAVVAAGVGSNEVLPDLLGGMDGNPWGWLVVDVAVSDWKCAQGARRR